MIGLSWWPLIVRVGVRALTTSFILWLKHVRVLIVIISLVSVLWFRVIWWKDIRMEIQSEFIKIGIVLFIFREVLFFRAFFWNFLNQSTHSDMLTGSIYPFITINPLDLPLLNTLILLRSGVTITIFHSNLLHNYFDLVWLLIRIYLGFYFLLIQIFEYHSSYFSIFSSTYGCSFFILTGFHGRHVMIGILFLSVMFILLSLQHYTPTHHVRVELSIWYWHFVDVVWVVLYRLVYCWGACIQ